MCGIVGLLNRNASNPISEQGKNKNKPEETMEVEQTCSSSSSLSSDLSHIPEEDPLSPLSKLIILVEKDLSFTLDETKTKSVHFLQGEITAEEGITAEASDADLDRLHIPKKMVPL